LKGSLLKLFDEQDRSDPAPCREGEDSYSFLNRVDTPYWAQVRNLLEDFFARYPAEHAGSLRGDFRSRLPGRHYAAWWELYLHELFLRLGYEITIHPAIEGTERKPDFGLRRDGSELLVEASVVFSGISGSEEETGAAPSWMLAAFEAVENSSFFVSIHEITARGEEQLKQTEIASPTEEWLAGLDPDQVTSEYEEEGRFPVLHIERRGWAVELEAWPVKPEARGRPGHRVLGSGPAMGGAVDDVSQLESKLKAKAGRYGRPEVPYVIAVLSLSGFMERIDIAQALFGREATVISDPDDAGRLIRQPNGFWFRGTGPINTRVSAVLMGVGLQAWSLTRIAPELWVNPWAENSLAEGWPFAVHTTLETGEVVSEEKDPALTALFDLPEGWPEGKPFPRK
jgi:hypothetical protein